MRRVPRVCLIALAGVIGVAAAVAVAWAVDSSLSGGQVARNTQIAGRPAGGLSRTELRRLVATVADEYRTAPVVIDAPQGGFTTNASDMGLSLDTAGTERAALNTGRSGNVLARIGSWAHG